MQRFVVWSFASELFAFIGHLQQTTVNRQTLIEWAARWQSRAKNASMSSMTRYKSIYAALWQPRFTHDCNFCARIATRWNRIVCSMQCSLLNPKTTTPMLTVPCFTTYRRKWRHRASDGCSWRVLRSLVEPRHARVARQCHAGISVSSHLVPMRSDAACMSHFSHSSLHVRLIYLQLSCIFTFPVHVCHLFIALFCIPSR